MKINQQVEMMFGSVYCSYKGLEFTDADGNEITILMNDDEYLELYKSVSRKAERIKEDRLEEARKELDFANEEI